MAAGLADALAEAVIALGRATEAPVDGVTDAPVDGVTDAPVDGVTDAPVDGVTDAPALPKLGKVLVRRWWKAPSSTATTTIAAPITIAERARTHGCWSGSGTGTNRWRGTAAAPGATTRCWVRVTTGSLNHSAGGWRVARTSMWCWAGSWAEVARSAPEHHRAASHSGHARASASTSALHRVHNIGHPLDRAPPCPGC